MIRQRIIIAGSAVGIAALLMTAGCSGASTGGGDASGTPSATASATPTSAAPTGSVTGSATGSPSEGTSEPSATSDPTSDAEPDTPRCLTPDLAGSVEAVEGGGSAGHYELAIVLTNEGADPCVLQGWPGVSFVGDDDGTQLGAAATLDRSSPHEAVTLDPGSVAHADVQVANAENFGEECGQTPADGFRVYPPGEKRSLYAANDQLTLTACTNADDELLDVQAFQPGS